MIILISSKKTDNFVHRECSNIKIRRMNVRAIIHIIHIKGWNEKQEIHFGSFRCEREPWHINFCILSRYLYDPCISKQWAWVSVSNFFFAFCRFSSDFGDWKRKIIFIRSIVTVSNWMSSLSDPWYSIFFLSFRSWMFHVTLWKLEHSILWPDRIPKLSRDTWLNYSLTIMIMQVYIHR